MIDHNINKDIRQDINQDIKQEYEETLEQLKSLTKFGINLGLGRIRALLERLGNPQDKLKVIHIGGTNGKGSTAAILQAILQKAGYWVGMFISPHLHDYRERITINGQLISPEEVTYYFGQIQPIMKDMVAQGLEHPTEFEVSTAMALLYFAENQPDLVILEVGMGGEIDSTNVVIPLISVITSIGMDHMDYLGHTLAEIAAVKAGIIKEGIPVVTSADKPEALKVIKEMAATKKSKLIKVGWDVRWRQRVNNDRNDSNRFDYLGLHLRLTDLELGLLGEHQFTNAAVALAVCELLVDKCEAVIPESSLREGLKQVFWPGRLELISLKPKILLDGAHNEDGMKTLVKALEDYDSGPLQRDKLVLIIGMLKDKEIDKAVQLIAPLAFEIIVTKPDSPRAGDLDIIANLAERAAGTGRISIVEDPVLAVQMGMQKIGPQDLLCVTGSLYMISKVREYLIRNK